MKRNFLISFFVLGLTSIIAQLAIIREVFGNFYGDELFIGLMVGFWFIWVAIGAIVLAKIFVKRYALKVLVACHFVIPFIFLAELILIRLFWFLPATAGSQPGLILSLSYLAICTAPFCLFLGLQFSVLGKLIVTTGEEEPTKFRKIFKWVWEKIFAKKSFTSTYLINQGYVFQLVGLTLGALAYYFALADLNFIALFFLLAIINFFTLLFLVFSRIFRFLLIGSILLVILYWLSFNFGVDLNSLTISWHFSGQQVLVEKNSQSSSIAITKTDNDQFNFYDNSLLVGSTQDNSINEQIVHFPLLYAAKSHNILLIGGGAGVINEVSKYPHVNIFYTQPFSQLVDLVKPYLFLNDTTKSDDVAINFISDSAADFLKNTDQKFDVIIISLPKPFSLSLNQFYTLDFFGLIKEKMNQGGIISLDMGQSLPQSQNFDALVYKSLNKVYPFLVILPDDHILFLASDKKIDYNPWPLRTRYNQYYLKNQFVTKDYITFRLTSDNVKPALATLAANRSVNLNTANRQTGFWLENLFWLNSQNPGSAQAWQLILNISLAKIIIASLILFLIIFYIFDVLIQRQERILGAVTIIPGFSLMAAEIILIFNYQIIFGNLYEKLSLIFFAFFAGMVFGVWLVNRLVLKNKLKYHYLFRLYFAGGLFFVILALATIYFNSFWQNEYFIFSSIFMTGFLAGLQFPLVNKFYLDFKHQPAEKIGMIYGLNLLSWGLGAILASLWVLPALGFTNVLIYLSLLNFLAFAALFFLRQDFEKE